MGRFVLIGIVIASVLLEVAFTVPSAINHERTKREERDWTDDAEDYAQDVLDQSWGGKCIQASDCLDYVAYCHKDADIALQGECRLQWWFLLILAVFVALLVSAIVSCICCPCCFLYSCCQSLCCCCCRSGYSMANH